MQERINCKMAKEVFQFDSGIEMSWGNLHVSTLWPFWLDGVLFHCCVELLSVTSVTGEIH